MPIKTPKLDDKRYEQLTDEALNRVPAHTPEWENLNESDPGSSLTPGSGEMGGRLNRLIPKRLIWPMLIGAAILGGLGLAVGLLPGNADPAALDPCSPANQTANAVAEATGGASRRIAITSFYIDEKGIIEMDPCATPLGGAGVVEMPDLDDPTRAPSAPP